MATPTVSQELQKSNPTLDDAAHKLYRLLEDHFDELGLSKADRSERYAIAEANIIQKDAVYDKASASREIEDGPQ